MGAGLTLLVAAGLVGLAGAVAMADAALGVVSVARAQALARDGRWGARELAEVAEDRTRHLHLLLLLRLLCELVATTLVALVAFGMFGLSWLAAVVTAGIMTAVSFLLVGLGPRTLGRRHAHQVGRFVAPAVRWLGRALRPLASLLYRIGNALPFGRRSEAAYQGSDPERAAELRELVDLARENGVVAQGEREMINSVVRLSDTVAREVMVPRTEMVWVEAQAPAQEALALALRSGFSRIPVVGATVDDVLGVVYLKDLARDSLGPQRQDGPVYQVMREPVFVPESKPVDDLLAEMQAARIHLAVVVDEYGGVAGLLTIEDILEEIVGEITDEYDVEVPPVQELPDGAVRVSARLPIDELGGLFGVSLPAEEVETVAGLLGQALGRVPIPGAAATVGGLRLVAEGTSGRRNRIETVLVRRALSAPDPAADGTGPPAPAARRSRRAARSA